MWPDALARLQELHGPSPLAANKEQAKEAGAVEPSLSRFPASPVTGFEWWEKGEGGKGEGRGGAAAAAAA